MKILFVHPPTGNAYELFNAFKENAGCSIEMLSNEKNKTFSLLYKIRYKLKVQSDLYNYNKLLSATDLSKIDVVFIVKGTMIYPKTLKKIKHRYRNIKIVSWALDNMYAWHNRTLFYTLGLKYYDLVSTTKTNNVVELKRIGAKKVFFHNNTYSKKLHRPLPNKSSKYNHDVLFIGALEKERFQSMRFLAEHGIEVHIYTDSWQESVFKSNSTNLIIHPSGLYGDDYAEAISNSKVTLCFLRKINRDQQTTRSIEIPACGGCMVAEYTEEHLGLFKEDKEAVFFKNDEELLNKIRMLLANPKKRIGIAKSGLERCKNSEYSYDNLAVKLINEIKNI